MKTMKCTIAVLLALYAIQFATSSPIPPQEDVVPETSPEDTLFEEAADPLLDPKSSIALPQEAGSLQTELTQELASKSLGKSLGCWRDRPRRAIGGGIRFRGSPKKCAAFAAKKGWSVYAIEFGKECFTGPSASRTYKKYGRGRNCRNGRGGGWAMNVYQTPKATKATKLKAKKSKPTKSKKSKPKKSTPTSLGCWRDRPRRAIAKYRFRGSPKKCAAYAAKKGWSVYAIEFGGQCFTGPSASRTYKKYGRAGNCRNGRGGGWAMNVYQMPKATKSKKLKSKKSKPTKSKKLKSTHLGCWRDRPRRAIGGGIRFRGSPKKCAAFAAKKGWSVYAIEFGKECFTGPSASRTYRKYGRGRNCRGGRGGGWAMDVYRLK